MGKRVSEMRIHELWLLALLLTALDLASCDPGLAFGAEARGRVRLDGRALFEVTGEDEKEFLKGSREPNGG